MTLIDLDRPGPRARVIRPWWAALISGALLLLLAGAQPLTLQPPSVPVMVTISGADQATAGIVKTSGERLMPIWDKAMPVSGGPVSVAVIGWATTTDAWCAISIDGRTVVERRAGGIGRPVSCVWPTG